MPEELKPGEKVVALAAAAKTAGIVAGAVSGGMAMWIARHRPAMSGVAFIAGGMLGSVFGAFVGKLIFPASGGNVVVAKAGPSSLPMTIKGNLAAAVVSGLIAVGMVVLATKADFRAVALAPVAASAAVGFVLALLTSLL